jgi:glycerol-3-phosphate dehydrogenase (NAD(P)+)
MRFGIIGNGSWGTALAKILTDNGHEIHWWNRSETAISQFIKRSHNPNYLQAARFNMQQLHLSTNLAEVIKAADVIVLAVPSAYVSETLSVLDRRAFEGKKILSAVKGIMPDQNKLVNDFLHLHFNVTLDHYFSVMGPCHAEEVAAEKLSYLTFSGINETATASIAEKFNTGYIKTVVNKDIFGVQYAAILKNIYALGAGIAHGMDYGDNFLSVLIANSADEMAGFLRKAGILNAEVGYIEHKKTASPEVHNNYAASVYMGDLLVTCYSLYSRNRTFGTMIGKGYSVKAAQLEMNMVAEGYNASRCMYLINEQIGAEMPIAKAVFQILWENKSCEEAFSAIEEMLV